MEFMLSGQQAESCIKLTDFEAAFALCDFLNKALMVINLMDELRVRKKRMLNRRNE